MSNRKKPNRRPYTKADPSADPHRCDATKARKRAVRPIRNRPVIDGLSGRRETKLLRRLAEGWRVDIDVMRLVRGTVRGCKVRWTEIGFLIQRGLMRLQTGITVAGKALIDHYGVREPVKAKPTPPALSKRILTIERHIGHDAPPVRSGGEALAVAASRVPAAGA